MTANQIEYWRNKENERHSRAQENIAQAELIIKDKQAAAAQAQAAASLRQAAVQEQLMASTIDKALASAQASRATARASEASADESSSRKFSNYSSSALSTLGKLLGPIAGTVLGAAIAKKKAPAPATPAPSSTPSYTNYTSVAQKKTVGYDSKGQRIYSYPTSMSLQSYLRLPSDGRVTGQALSAHPIPADPSMAKKLWDTMSEDEKSNFFPRGNLESFTAYLNNGDSNMSWSKWIKSHF